MCPIITYCTGKLDHFPQQMCAIITYCTGKLDYFPQQMCAITTYCTGKLDHLLHAVPKVQHDIKWLFDPNTQWILKQPSLFYWPFL